jgi:hypothetical protein
MIRGLWPSVLAVRLTKCALKQASMPTMHGGSFRRVSASASRLILRRKHHLSISGKADQMEHVFADVDSDHRRRRGGGC